MEEEKVSVKSVEDEEGKGVSVITIRELASSHGSGPRARFTAPLGSKGTERRGRACRRTERVSGSTVTMFNRVRKCFTLAYKK